MNFESSSTLPIEKNEQVTADLMSLKDAATWASEYLQKKVTSSNISYLVQYGRIPKKGNDIILVSKTDLENYYNSFKGQREFSWKDKLGNDLNWALSFDNLRETDTTKHVHRLHPYKGKFIPQLVEYFLDNHTDVFKTRSYFQKDDIVLDPFAGSGTTLVQAKELGMHAIGIDVSEFNALINNCKRFLADDYDIFLVANDKYNLYPQIAEKAEMQIVNHYKRPVLNRTEKDKGAYSEIIFHLKKR